METNFNDRALPFTYVVSPGALANGETGQTILTLQQDSDFELHEIALSCSVDDMNDPESNNASVIMSDQSTGRQFSNARIPQVLVNKNNGKLLRPVKFKSLSNIGFDFLNLTANSNTPTLILRGFKLFN
jgi:hypothetical protein